MIVCDIQTDMQNKERVYKNKTADQYSGDAIGFFVQGNHNGDIKADKGNIEVHKCPNTQSWFIF